MFRTLLYTPEFPVHAHSPLLTSSRHATTAYTHQYLSHLSLASPSPALLARAEFAAGTSSDDHITPYDVKYEGMKRQIREGKTESDSRRTTLARSRVAGPHRPTMVARDRREVS